MILARCGYRFGTASDETSCYAVDEVAVMLGITELEVRVLITTGELLAHHGNSGLGRTFVTETALDDYRARLARGEVGRGRSLAHEEREDTRVPRAPRAPAPRAPRKPRKSKIDLSKILSMRSDGFSFGQIAEALHCSRSRVRVMYRQAESS